MDLVAIIGSGPGGLVAASYLRKEGFETMLFEAGRELGGQWSGDKQCSAVWPEMRTNTTRIMTAFSDLQHETDAAAFLHNESVRVYLRRFAEKCELLPFIRTGTRVREISLEPNGKWCIRYTGPDRILREQLCSHVVVASGRCQKPNVPANIGLNSFTGKLLHTREYDGPDQHRGKRVAVIGCSVSALEIASELAFAGGRVFAINRRQRFILPKFLAGIPVDHAFFTRAAALALESLPVNTVMADLRRTIVNSAGSPDQYGTAAPPRDLLEAGITQCQHFLPLVGEGKIRCRPWIGGIDGQNLCFVDGSTETVDTVICGTGYRVDLPFLSDDLLDILRYDGQSLDLYKSTFHPDLPNLAFLGIYDLFGPYFPVLELQARWIAYVWSGAVPLVQPEQMRRELTCNDRLPMHTAALSFARAAGVEPELEKWPNLARALLFGPLSSVSFRLSGRDSLSEAPQRVESEAKLFGAIPSPEFTESERAQVDRLRSQSAGQISRLSATAQ